jgi:hypothetical protein
MPALLGRGGLALRARAQLAAARAALATTATVAALAADPSAVLAPLEAAAAGAYTRPLVSSPSSFFAGQTHGFSNQ